MKILIRQGFFIMITFYYMNRSFKIFTAPNLCLIFIQIDVVYFINKIIKVNCFFK